MKNLKRSGGSPNFQFNGIIAVVDVYFFWKQRPADKSLNIQEPKAKASLVRSLVVIVREHTS